ncbi:MAG TPA: hypothetical protein VLF41_02555 [Candidatus Nanoarchaeia archaeon]|nr:hypothetical protein [Candidatus Nanoarchaeia archaeon]
MDFRFFFLRLLSDIDLFKNVNIDAQGINAVPVIIANLINILMFFAGVLSVIFVIIGGIRYATSAGNPTAVQGAKKTLTYAIGGLLLSLLAVVIVNFIFIKSFLR